MARKDIRNARILNYIKSNSLEKLESFFQTSDDDLDMMTGSRFSVCIEDEEAVNCFLESADSAL